MTLIARDGEIPVNNVAKAVTRYDSSVALRLLSQPLEEGKGRIAVRLQAVLLLIDPERGLAGLAELAVDLANIITHFLEPRLHVAGLSEAQASIMDRPGAGEFGAAHCAV